MSRRVALDTLEHQRVARFEGVDRHVLRAMIGINPLDLRQ
jgi:hypothetical protein